MLSFTKSYSNLGIIFAFMIFFLGTYLVGSEMIAAARSKGEVLVFRKTHLRNHRKPSTDKEAASTPRVVVAENTAQDSGKSPAIYQQTDIFQWKDVCYDIQIKKETRRILDQVDGWVKPGTLTALMVSPSVFLRSGKANIFYRVSPELERLHSWMWGPFGSYLEGLSDMLYRYLQAE